MMIVIASKRAPKVDGVKRAFQKISSKFGFEFSSFRFETMNVESGVSSTPLSLGELMLGARQRAESAFQKAKVQFPGIDDFLAVGVEGGVHVEQTAVFLQSWACVFDGGQSSFGSSGSIEIPSALARAVVQDKADLGAVIDLFAEKHDIRSRQGTWGILTDDVITREDSFETATVNALMPVFNRKIYDRVLKKEMEVR